MGLETHRQRSEQRISVHVVTLSDTRHQEDDQGGRLVADLCSSAGLTITGRSLLREDRGAIQEALEKLLETGGFDVLILTGGTGVAPRDHAFDILHVLYERPLPGFGELFRWLSYEEIGSASLLSRASAGIVADKLLFSIPGSTGAVDLAMNKLILPEIQHLISELHRDTQ